MKVSVKRGPAQDCIANTDVKDGEIVYFSIGRAQGLLQRNGERGVVIGQPSRKTYPRLFTGPIRAQLMILKRVDLTSIRFDANGNVSDFKIHDASIGANEMRDGDVGEIVEHPYDLYTGRVIQRVESGGFVALGKPFGRSFDSLTDAVKVRLVQPGDQIVFEHEEGEEC